MSIIFDSLDQIFRFLLRTEFHFLKLRTRRITIRHNWIVVLQFFFSFDRIEVELTFFQSVERKEENKMFQIKLPSRRNRAGTNAKNRRNIFENWKKTIQEIKINCMLFTYQQNYWAKNVFFIIPNNSVVSHM